MNNRMKEQKAASEPRGMLHPDQACLPISDFWQ